MDKVIGPLALAVTVLGFVLFVLAMFFLLRGDKLPKSDGSPNTIKYGGIELATDRVVMLCLVFAGMIALPLVGLFILQDRTAVREAAQHERDAQRDLAVKVCQDNAAALTKELEGLKQRELRIFAIASDKGGNPLSRLQAEVARVRGSDEQIECKRKAMTNGEYRCFPTLKDLNDKFELRILDPSAATDKLIASKYISPDEYNVPVTVETGATP